MTYKEKITVEKEVYEAVLRNSVRVNDLEAENAQLRKFLEEFNALDVAEENQRLKELLKECRNDVNHIISNVYLCKELLDLLTKIDNVLGADNDKK